MFRTVYHVLFATAVLTVAFGPTPALVRVAAGFSVGALLLEAARPLVQFSKPGGRREGPAVSAITCTVASTLVLACGFAFVGATVVTGSAPAVGLWPARAHRGRCRPCRPQACPGTRPCRMSEDPAFVERSAKDGERVGPLGSECHNGGARHSQPTDTR